MDIFATSFTFPRPDSHSFSNYATGGVARSHHYASLVLHDTLSDRAFHIVQNVTREAMEIHGCVVSFTKSDIGTYNFYLSGAYQQVTNARAMIIRECPIMVRVPLKVTRADLSSAPIRASSALRPEFYERVNQISTQTLTQISVHPVPPNGVSASPQLGLAMNGNGKKSGQLGYFGLETDRVCDVVIVGASDQVDVARIRCLVAIDEFAGLYADTCEIDHKLQPIVAGIKRNFIQNIQESTNTNIYMPFLLQGLSGPQSPPLEPLPGNPGAPRPNQNVIWITGESFSVQRAKDMLLQAAATVTKTIISMEATLIPRKLDWMLTEKMEDLRTIMRDNGTYIKFPAIGSVTSTITVLGTSRVHVQRTIRSAMQLACQYFTATVWMLPQQYNVMMPPQMQLGPHIAQIEHILRTISCNSGAEVVFKSNTVFEVHGLDKELVSALSLILELDLMKTHRLEIHIRLELAVDQREFISGKKNGKLNKIHQLCGCKIKYETLNEYNFLIDIAGPDNSVLHGLQLLQDELPGEISFHVPEAYHKRIIGVGGRSIQRIMKKYGVYVKFSNADEFAALGGYNDNMDNVIARTPRKNSANLELLKQAVLEAISPKDRDYIHEAFTVPRKYHRMLLGEKAPFIHDIEKQTNCQIRFPDKEIASDMIDIFGPEGPVSTASSMLMEHVPFEADWSVPACPELPALLTRPEWALFTDRIKTEVEVNITAFPAPPSPAPTPRSGDPHDPSPAPTREHFFRLRCQRSHKESINAARDYLEEFIVQHNIPVYSDFTGGAHRRNDSFADAFPHFNSKVLSATAGPGHVPDSPDYPRHPEILPGPPLAGRLRLAASHPDVKALYNSGAYVYQMNEKLPDHDEQPEDEVSNQGDKFWRPSLLGPPPMGGVPVHKSRHQPDPAKRGSDSLINAKFTKPRSFANRAQSLDLTYSLARVTEASNRMPRPNSPTESTIDTGATPSPTSGTAPSFPSMYAPSAASFGPGSVPGHRQAQSIDAAAAEHEDITRVISGLKM